jgi:peptidoglycan/LPS O-acetylase OafA/YrhL
MSLIGAPFGILTRQTVLGSALQQVPWNIGFTGVIGLSLLAGASRWKAFVAPRILVFFGSISYGLYIVHQLVFSLYNRFAPNVLPQPWAVPNSWLGLWLRFAIAGAIATAIAFLSRRYFEEPFLRLKDKVT